MKAYVWASIAAGLFVSWCAWVAMGCTPEVVPTPKQQEAVANDFLEQKRCIEMFSTREAIDNCRSAVKARRDAGL